MTCRLTLLGPPQLLDDQGRLIPIPAKAFALVAYILLTSSGALASRASLRQFLWDTPDTKTAATNLRKFLLRIRQRQKQFGFELIREERDHVRLAPSVDIDLARFLQVAAVQGPDDLAALCDLYRGELLEGFAWEEPEVREWLEVQRAKLRDSFVSVVSNWLEASGPSTDRMSLRIAARRLIEVEPYNETGHRTLMRLFAEDGEPARVRGVYRNLEERLRTDLGVKPDLATTELFQSLLLGQGAQGGAQGIERSNEAGRPEPQSNRSAANEWTDAHFGRLLPSAPTRAGNPRITILPPLPLTGQDYLHHIAVSLIEDVTIGLCRFKSLSVVAPQTAWELSVNGKKALFKTFGIEYAVETQLQNRGGEPWLSVRLLEATRRNVLWTDQFALNRAQETHHYQLLSVQILSTVVDRIERAELARYDTEQNPTAYHFYLAGQKYLRTLDLPNIRRARRAFKEAIGACGDFVPGISGLARTYQLEWVLLARGELDLLREAEKLARLSIEIDPDDARGYRELGVCTLYTGRFDESLEALGSGELRNPQFADLLTDFGDALIHAGEPAIGLQKVGQAIDLNPLCPDWYRWVAAGANFHLHRYDEAVANMLLMRDQSPAYRLLAASYAMMGAHDEAGDYVRKAKEIHPDFNVAGWLAVVPIKDPKYAQHYEQGLREAGFD